MLSRTQNPLGAPPKGGAVLYGKGAWFRVPPTGCVVPEGSGRATGQTLKIHTPCDPEIPLFGTIPCKMPKLLDAPWSVLAQEESRATGLARGREVVACRELCSQEQDSVLALRRVLNLLSENKSKMQNHGSVNFQCLPGCPPTAFRNHTPRRRHPSTRLFPMHQGHHQRLPSTGRKKSVPSGGPPRTP